MVAAAAEMMVPEEEVEEDLEGKNEALLSLIVSI